MCIPKEYNNNLFESEDEYEFQFVAEEEEEEEEYIEVDDEDEGVEDNQEDEGEDLVEDEDEEDSVLVIEMDEDQEWWEEDLGDPNGGHWRTTMGEEQEVEGEDSDEGEDEVEIIYEMIQIDWGYSKIPSYIFKFQPIFFEFFLPKKQIKFTKNLIRLSLKIIINNFIRENRR